MAVGLVFGSLLVWFEATVLLHGFAARWAWDAWRQDQVVRFPSPTAAGWGRVEMVFIPALGVVIEL